MHPLILGMATLYIQTKTTMLLENYAVCHGLGIFYQCFFSFPKTTKAFSVEKIKNLEVIEFLERMECLSEFVTYYFQANLLSLLHKIVGIWP